LQFSAKKQYFYTCFMIKGLKYILLISAFQLTGITVFSQQVPLTLSGTYQERPVFVKNPYRSEKVGFCVSKVTVNGNVTTDEINSSSFEIDLSLYSFVIGDPVEIIIYHDKNCKPKVINPEALTPKSTYTVGEIAVDGDQNLVWTTTGEKGKLDFVVEQYKWGEWVEVGRVMGEGKESQQRYKFKIVPHSGENKYRVSQKDYTGKVRPSKEVIYRSDKEKVTFYPKKVRKDIVFSNETSYKILDRFGNTVVKGRSAKIDCTDLKKGFYYLSFDNETATFNKK